MPPPPSPPVDLDLSSPFGTVDGLDSDDIRTTAYEIFFTSCRSSPGFGGRNAIQFYSSTTTDNTTTTTTTNENTSGGSPSKSKGATSRFKRAVGLKMLKRSLSHRKSTSSSSGGIGFSTVPGRKARRPMTCAEIMREQMKVSEASDNRLRKTLMRTLVGQMGRRAETIILPLELLRHLKPTEFNDANEYHVWQKRQLKILEVGLLLHPSTPLSTSPNNHQLATSLREIIRNSAHDKPLDTGRTSEPMRIVCHCVVSLAWRSPDSSPTEVCHWADGFPFNVHLYLSLLASIFDLKEQTCVLDEVDELLELMKKTWTTLGFNKPMHDLCFTWVLFHQYVITGRTEKELLSASLTMLTEVANDSKKVDREPVYVEMLSIVLTSMTVWCEKRLFDYHASFGGAKIGGMEYILPLVFSATRILEEDVPAGGVKLAAANSNNSSSDSTLAAGAGINKVDQYTRSSLKNAFSKMVESGMNVISRKMSFQQVCETLIRVAQETEELAFKEKGSFSMVLKKWHPISAGVAAVTLHSCYGALLKQFLTCNSDITIEMLTVLQRADKLEKLLVNMVVEDSVECEDGGMTVVREMVLYEVDSIIFKFLGQSIAGRLKRIKVVVHKAKENETWNPKSKTEPYSQSAVELIKQARDLVACFFDIPIAISEDLVHEFADGIEKILEEYATFVASCGSKENYIPTLPPLTRCGRDSKFIKLWKKATPCAIAGLSPYNLGLGGLVDQEAEGGSNINPRPSTSRGTQRLYIRLNTLHYIISQLSSLDKCLFHHPPSKIQKNRNNNNSSSRHVQGPHFEHTRSVIISATQHVCEVSAYRLIFLDSNSVLYGNLYEGHVVNARITPALRVVKQNLTLLSAIVTERAQPLAVKQVMKACFEAFVMVLIAGGSTRSFSKADHEMIEEDLKHLKRLFGEEVVEKEEVAQTVEGVVELMGKSTEQLVEEFVTLVGSEGSGGMGGASGGGSGAAGQQTLPMPPTTGRWSSSDPNTILRVLCHRKDRVANLFLKTTFHLAKRA